MPDDTTLAQPATQDLNLLPTKPLKKKRSFLSTFLWFLFFLVVLVGASGVFYFLLRSSPNFSFKFNFNNNNPVNTPSVQNKPEDITTSAPAPTSTTLVGIWQFGPTLESGWNERYQFYKSGKYRHFASSMDCANRNKEDAGYWTLFDGKLTLTPITETHLVGGSEATATGTCSAAVMINGGVLQVLPADYNPRTFILGATESAAGSRVSVRFNDDTLWKYFSDEPSLYNENGNEDIASFEEPVFSRYLRDDAFYIYKGTWKRADPAQPDFELILNTDGAYLYGGYCVKSLDADNQECVYDYSVNSGIGVVGFIHDGEAYIKYKTLKGSTGEAVLYYNVTTKTMTWRLKDGNDSSVVPLVAVLTLSR
jgi:hypothetical protein